MTTATYEPVAERATPSPWWWIPSLYFDQGIPYVVVMTLSVIMYKNVGISNADIALYTSWLYLPWVIKPLWSPIVDMFGTKRTWIVVLQLAVGASLGLIALTIQTTHFFQITLAILWLVAFSSATHDIAADGFYLLALTQERQAAFVGVRSTFYRIATIAGQGGLVYLAGKLASFTGNVKLGWAVTFGVIATLFLVTFVWHRAVLPRPESDRATKDSGAFRSFLATFVSFFDKKGIIVIVGFLLSFRLGEAQALKLVTPFLLDSRERGGLGLDTSQVGIVYGTVGLTALTLGGLLGGYMLSKHGLKKLIWIMLASTHVPCLAFVALSTILPRDLPTIGFAIAVEQFGYGFGFSAYLLFMIMVAAEGKQKAAHYSICTGFMALGMMLPGMVSGWIQERLGYPKFFLWVLACAIPSVVITAFVKIDPAFGKRA
jgi:MFS transporter, PAT family, beta-lactamase induction signal transducer AmpG